MKINKYNGKMNIVGQRVKEARMKAGISQANLAAKLQTNGVNIEQKAISRIENGDRLVVDFELLELSKTLDVGVEWLLNGYRQ